MGEASGTTLCNGNGKKLVYNIAKKNGLRGLVDYNTAKA